MKFFKKEINTEKLCFNNKPTDIFANSSIDNRNPNYLVIDDMYYSGVMVVDYPRIIDDGLLERLIYLDINVNITMFYEKINSYDVIKKLTYHIGNVNTDIKMSSKNKQDYEILNITYNDAMDIRKELQINNESIYNFYMYFTIYEDSYEKLKDKLFILQSVLFSYGLVSKVPYFRHIYLYQTTLPFNNNLPEIKINSKRNMITKTLSSFYPFISSNVCDISGILFGYNLQNKSLVIVDRFNKDKYINSNMCVFGASGAGKSYFVKLQIIRNSLLNIKQLVIDPEGEYQNISKAIGGEYIKLGNNTNTFINVFDIYEQYGENINYLQEKIQNLLIFFSIIYPDMSVNEKGYLEEKIIECYREKGITFDNSSLYCNKRVDKLFIKPKFKDYAQMPIMEDLYNCILKDNRYTQLTYMIKPFVTGSMQYFNNYTNINKDNKNIIVDISDVKEEYIDLNIFMLTEFFWNIVKQNNTENKIVYIDEIWRLINSNSNKVCANFVVQIFKTIRKYGGGATAITQDISDLVVNKNVYGKSIINNSCFKCIFKLDEENIIALKQLIFISEAEEQRITSVSRGECLLMLDKNNVVINISSSKYESNIINNSKVGDD